MRFLTFFGANWMSVVRVMERCITKMDGYAFVYRYDSRLRCVSKRVPGCVAELTAYDTQGRVAYSRDGSVGSMGRKRFYLYDEYSRLAASGVCEDFTSESEWSAEHEAQTLRRAAGEKGSAGDYEWESVTLPTAAQVTDVRYYDRYLPEQKMNIGIAAPLGLVTAERTMEMEYGMPGAAVWVTHHYNAMGQEIQSVETRPEGDKVLWSGSYTVGGLPLQSNSMVSGAGRYHTLNVGTGYDAFGRVREQKCVTNLGGGVLLERNEYDGAGRLAGTVTQGGLRTTYSYDARGALMERKDSLLEMMYSYATGDAPSYAGRISGRKTRVRNGMGYDVVNSAYRYDAMGRLVESTVKQGTSELPVKPVFPPLEPAKAGALLLPADHSEAFTYDLNANVLTIERKGRDDAGQCRVVDDVEMTYAGNRLSVLRDAAADALLEGSMDMPEGVYSGYDIRYDAAGRLTRDVSRGIANINYSVTGMPWVVGTMSGDCAEYGYTSSGVKLWERIYNGNRTTRREYVGPCEYVDGKLMRVNVSQGYIDSLGVLHAYIRDIQGNVAGVYAAKAGKKSLEQLNWYYAYGGLTADSRGQDRNRYKHTGKELVTDLGLNSYDFTARWQYPMAGAFSSPDAKASDYKWLSPYAFCGGDPINYVDPTGNRVTLYATQLPGFKLPVLIDCMLLRNLASIPTHTFIVVSTSDGKKEIFAYGSEYDGFKGSYSGRLTRRHYNQDREIAEGEEQDKLKACIEIEPPGNMTEDEFDKKVIEVANSFDENDDKQYFILPHNENQGNCNTSTSTILIKAGVPEKQIVEIKKNIPGNSFGFSPRPKPWTEEDLKKPNDEE